MSSRQDALEELLAIMARLRSADGCPWDRVQTFATIAPYTLEEAYEVADAIERNDRDDLLAELGDLLLQVVFHARMAEELGWFDFADVSGSIRDKLIRRHPNVFADARVETAAEQTQRWEQAKSRERSATAHARRDSSELADVPRALPALVRAAKLGRRAGAVGFDWPHARAVREKVTEELAELDEQLAGVPPATESARSARIAEELGDLLLAIVNWSRHLEVDAEGALRAANAKFERRFRRMEAFAQARGLVLADLSALQWDELWREAKEEG